MTGIGSTLMSRVGMKPGEKNCSELCNDSEVEE